MLSQVMPINDRKYNIEGLKNDYFSLLTTFRSTKDKKERRQLAIWINQIKEILEEQGVDPLADERNYVHTDSQ